MENNKLTPKKRAKIYLEAAIFFQKQENFISESNIDRNFIYVGNIPAELRSIGRSMGVIGFCDFVECKYDMDCESFAEYQTFKPEEFHLYWFKNQHERVNALLLSYQMALDAKE